MPDVTAKSFDEMDAALGGIFIRARAELGVTAFGLAIGGVPGRGFVPTRFSQIGAGDDPSVG